jgi:hypothetical protein
MCDLYDMCCVLFAHQRLEGGLHTLQQIAVTLAYICVYKNRDIELLRRVSAGLEGFGGEGLSLVRDAIREMAASMGEEEGEAAAANRTRHTLVEWSACLATIEERTSREFDTEIAER